MNVVHGGPAGDRRPDWRWMAVGPRGCSSCPPLRGELPGGSMCVGCARADGAWCGDGGRPVWSGAGAGGRADSGMCAAGRGGSIVHGRCEAKCSDLARKSEPFALLQRRSLASAIGPFCREVGMTMLFLKREAAHAMDAELRRVRVAASLEISRRWRPAVVRSGPAFAPRRRCVVRTSISGRCGIWVRGAGTWWGECLLGVRSLWISLEQRPEGVGQETGMLASLEAPSSSSRSRALSIVVTPGRIGPPRIFCDVYRYTGCTE